MPDIPRRLSSFTKKEISEAFKKSRIKIKGRGLLVLLSPRKKSFGRILTIIPKGVGSAPLRNLIKRRLKSIFFEDRLFNLNFDYIVIVSKEAVNFNFNELRSFLLKIADEYN